ncbi:hypothetical protein B0H10DRAFT_2443212 [Mycena sp. CBHHK59/15]|nr:hypothetical protein B0H10DRAFT_2443212 [Mycena sp. CBHHK59/15]
MGLIQDLIAMDEGRIDKATYVWPRFIDYAKVSATACREISTLVEKYAENSDIAAPVIRHVIPETPQHRQIARQVDLRLAQRQFYAAQRAIAAKAHEDSLRLQLQPILDFLRAARRKGFESPHNESELFTCLGSVRATLDIVEAMVVGDVDLDMTESDTEEESGS